LQSCTSILAEILDSEKQEPDHAGKQVEQEEPFNIRSRKKAFSNNCLQTKKSAKGVDAALPGPRFSAF
jgi:hypothetical protein